MLKRACLVVCIVGACLPAAGCGEQDLTSIRLSLNDDGSGRITVVSVEAPDQGFAVEGASSGVSWSRRVSVNASAGEFSDATALEVADIDFHWGVGDEGMGRLKVVVPLGSERRWVRTIAPITENQRTELAETFDPTGAVKTVGASVRIVVELPGNVVSSGAVPARGGTAASHKKNTATLTVPVDFKAPHREAIVWHITWQQ
jgi:hypothetical protein